MKKDKRQEDLKSYESPIVRLMEIKLEQGFVIGSGNGNHEGFVNDAGNGGIVNSMSGNHEGFANDAGNGGIVNGMSGNHEGFQ